MIFVIFINAKISKATISKIVQSLDLAEPLEIIFADIPKIKIPQHLYINVDETFVKLRYKKKMHKYRFGLIIFKKFK